MKNKHQSGKHQKSTSGAKTAPSPAEHDESDQSEDTGTFVSLPILGSGNLDRLVDTAKDYARQATAENTNTAYKADWAHFTSWCRRRGTDPLSESGADPQ